MKKKNIFKITLTIIISFAIIIFTYFDSFLYKESIMQITKVSESFKNEEVNNIYKEKYYTQEITGIILNGKDKGKKVYAINERSTSNVYDENYKKGDKVFVSVLNNKNSTVSIENYKRDVYVVSIIIIFVDSLIAIGSFQGLLAIIALIVNMIVYAFAIHLYVSKKINLMFLSCICTVLFSIISMLLAIGLNKKALSTIISTVVSTFITVLIAYLVMSLTHEKGVRIEQIDFLLTPYKEVFISELLLGGLGAIMDIAITISSTVNELVEKNKNISNKTLFLSCKEIGKDTMGTMLNVLLFTYICASMPKFILYYRNNFSAIYIMKNYLSIDIVRSLVAGIGIALSIPITSFIAIKILKGGRK